MNIYLTRISVLTARTNIEGVSFAIRIDDARSIIKCLTQQKKIIRPVIGAKMVSLKDANRMQLSESFIYSPDQKGVLVTFVTESSPAENGGLLKGDIICLIDGDPISNTHEVMKKIGLRINEEIHLTVLRNIPFEQDWSGRTFTFFTEVKEIVVKTSDAE